MVPRHPNPQKFILYLEFKNAGFKSMEFKNSFSTWGSKMRGSKVTGSKMQSSKIWSSKIHSCLRVQKSGVQRFRVQKFISYLEFKNSGFKYLGSKLRVQISWVQIFTSHIYAYKTMRKLQPCANCNLAQISTTRKLQPRANRLHKRSHL